MAIDKNSKAYQALQKSGYTDEQITQMHGATSSGQSAQQVIQANTPQNTPERATTTYQNQGAGNYVFNEKTGYYENTSNPSMNTTNQGIEAKPEKQTEKPISTVSENTNSDTMRPLGQDYYQQTDDDALNKIRFNLNNYRQTNPEYFSDYETFKKNFSYDKRVAEQQNVLDEWYKGYTKGLQYSSTPTNDLYTQYMNGQISTTDLENLRIANPTKYAELQAQINKGSIISAYDDNKDTSPTNIQEIGYNMAAEAFKAMESGDYGTSQFFDEFKANMDSPEMMELSDKLTDIDEQRQNILDQISSMTKDIEKEYEGTGATKSKINAIVSDRTYELQQQLRTLDHEYTKYATQYNNRAQQYQNEFQLQLQEYQINMQARNQQMNELGFALDLMNWETNEQRQQREWDYWVKQQEYTNGNIYSDDYQTRHKAALKSVENLLAQYPGIPTQRSAEQMADDILKAIDNGSNLGAELTKINKFMQEKPEYKKLYNATYGDSQGITDSFVVGDTQYVVYDGKMMTSDDFNKQYGNKRSNANYNVVSGDVISKGSHGKGTYGSFMERSGNKNGAYGGQCGKYANDYLEEIGAGRMFGNEDITTREGWINSDSGKVGTIAIFDYGKTSSDGINHGHVGIVVSQPDSNGNFWVKESNFKGDEKITTRMVNMKDASLKGFFDPTLSPDGGVISTTTTTTSSKGATTTTTTTEMHGSATTSDFVEEDGMVHLGSTKLTTSQFDNYVKKFVDGTVSYAEVKSLGDDALNKVTERALQLGDEGYTPSTKITDPNKQASLESSLRKEYDNLTEDVNATISWVEKMDDAYGQVDENLNAASQALVIAYNKILDESSVVREGEYARTSEGQSLLDKMGAKVKQIAKGGAGITKGNLKSLVDLAHTFSKNAENYRNEMANRAKVSIDKYGLTPEAVLPASVLNGINGTDNTNTVNTGIASLPKSSDVFQVTKDVGGNFVPANFYAN